MTALALLGGALLGGCDAPGSSGRLARLDDPQAPGNGARGRTLEEIRASGRLRVVTRNAPTTYYLDRHELPAGPEYDTVAAFAEHLGVAVELVIRHTPAEVLAAIDAEKADIAAAGLTATQARGEHYQLGPGYQRVTEQVVCHREGPRAGDVAALADVSLAVAAGTSYVDTLQALGAGQPGLTWAARPTGTEQLLAEVADRKLDCTVADSHIVALNRRYYPGLSVEFDLGASETLVWIMPRGALTLRRALEDWFATSAAREALEQAQERYYAYATIFDFVELRAYQRRLESRFPKYRDLFEAAAERYDLPPLLLAAQAYQESRWDPKAKSPTGVRGMMMLTQNTAQAVGVKDRLDPAQSIEGGAKYLDRMRRRFAEHIPEPDRTYLALAAYNIGRAHMHDAQTLARERGGDPGSWLDVKAVLPLLADEAVYPDLKYGYARGSEPVRYVERIRNYEDILRAELRAAEGAGRGQDPGDAAAEAAGRLAGAEAP